MNASYVAQLGRVSRVSGVALVAGALALAPSLASAANSSGTTLRATIGGDGTVSSARMYNADGSSSAFTGDLPLTMKISHTASGSSQTYTYHVVNNVAKTETIHYEDTAGNPLHSTVTVQLPLVAQLTVTVPKSLKDVNAIGASIITGADGSRQLSWGLVLFAPLGAAAQDVSFTASGSGSPVADMRASVVDPNSAPGLSAASQDATAAYQQEDFWRGYSGGAKKGLGQIASGVAQLHSGIAQGADGANQLADGSAQAYSGSKSLTSGIGKIHGGLVQVADPKKGLPTAVGGIDQMLAGLGSASQGTTLVGGLTCLKDVLGRILTGTLPAPNGDGSLGKKDQCFYSKTLNPSAAIPPMAATTGINAIILGNIVKDAAGAPSALTQLIDGVDSPDPKTPGLKQGLQQLRAGIAKAVDGIKQLAAGSGQAFTGAKQLSSGLGQISDGQRQVAAGLPSAVSGTQQLLDGVNQVKNDAVGPLDLQLGQASENNHKALAVLQAASALGSSAPGGSGASYVYTQNPNEVALAANAAKASGGSSHTGRNVGIGLGGFALLLVGLGGGFLMGRSRSRTTTTVA